MRRLVSSGYPMEDAYGYSRAVRVDNQIYLSGTTARDAALSLDVHGQAMDALATVEAALIEAGASLADVVKTVAYLTDLELLDGVTRAHRRMFAAVRPASTVVEVSRLSPEAALVEFDVIAVIQGDAAAGGRSGR